MLFIACRSSVVSYRLDSLESRVLLSVAEPNDTFTQAYTPPDNIYLEQNYVATNSVNASGDRNDYFKFYNLYGPSHLRANLDGLSADADLYVYDQNQNPLASGTLGGSQSETINVDLPGNQYFYVRVYGFSGATNYSLFLYNDYAGSTLATARDIGASWGQSSDKFWAYGKITWTDYLDYADTVDLVKFRMEANGTISLRQQPINSDPGGLQDNMQLLDSSGNVLADAAPSSGGGFNLDRYSAPAGTYYVKFTQLSGSGPYTYRIVSDYAGDVTGTARDLGDITNTSRQEYDMVGTGFSGLASYADATDLYKFTLSKTAPLDLQLSVDTSAFPTPTFGAHFSLARDTNGDGFIESNEIIASGSGSADRQLIHTSLSAGTYYVLVEPNQNAAYTSYQLDLDSDFDAVPSAPAPYSNLTKAIDAGPLIGETFFTGGFGISAGDFSDFYKFQMSAPGTLLASVFLNPYYSRTAFIPGLVVLQDKNSNGYFDSGENVTPFSSTGTLIANLAAGTYYIHVTGDGEQSAYQLRLVSGYAGNSLNTARVMSPVSGPNPPTQTFKDYIEQDFGPGSNVNDVYRFDLPTTYTVTLKTTGVSGEDLALQLIKDANNNGVIDSGDIIAVSDALNSPNETITRTLPAGRYFARVHGVNGATNYVLTANFANGDTDPDDTLATADVRALGQFVDFSMNPATDVDMIKFTASAGQKASFNVNSRNGSNLDTYLRLFNSSGTQLAANNDGAAPGETNSKFSYLEYVFPASGTYYIGVSLNPNKAYNPILGNGDVPGGAMGDYRLYLNNLGAATPSIIRVNAGGSVYIDTGGKYFSADGGFSSGSISNTSFTVAGTSDPYLYYTLRHGSNFSFSRTVANGTYQLTLNFTENVYIAAGKRKFNVFAQGTKILSNFDIFSAAGGAKRAYSKTFAVNVTNGKINLSFVGVVGEAELSALSLVKG